MNGLNTCSVLLIAVYEDLVGLPTYQSSTAWGAEASRATDGSGASNFMEQYSCSHTDFEIQPWLAVDLQDTYAMFNMVINNRKDCCGMQAVINHAP